LFSGRIAQLARIDYEQVVRHPAIGPKTEASAAKFLFARHAATWIDRWSGGASPNAVSEAARIRHGDNQSAWIW
jgi:hypothetical protein